MGNNGDSGVLALVSAIVGGSVLLLFFLVRLIRGEQKAAAPAKSKHVLAGYFRPRTHSRNSGGLTACVVADEKARERQAAAAEKRNWEQPAQKAKKKAPPRAEQKQPAFSNLWLLNSLKGHTGQVMDMDFSPNGKYLASCADGTYPNKRNTCYSIVRRRRTLPVSLARRNASRLTKIKHLLTCAFNRDTTGCCSSVITLINPRFAGSNLEKPALAPLL